MTADKHVRGWEKCGFSDGTKPITIARLALPDNAATVHVVDVHIAITTDCKMDSIVCWEQCFNTMPTSELVGYVGSRPFLDVLL